MPSPPSGRSISVYIASAIVRVSPGMFDTKLIVAPNSPSAFANARLIPATRPGRLSGSVTCRNAAHGRAPRPDAASCTSRGIASIDSRIARTNSGNAITAAAITAPVQRNANVRPNHAYNQCPIAPCRPSSTSST